jgi:NADPH-dependent glutamate synthase beta subunit-like oxidoreductase
VISYSLNSGVKLAVRAYSVAIVGAGPAGFYTAKYLTDGSFSELSSKVTRVDIIEKLPVPYGLVRFGVAPDHEPTKSVMATFQEVGDRDRVRFLGNVAVGESGGPSVDDLLQSYNAVVLAHGAVSDTPVGCPGEDLDGVVSARAVVNWYNGHPDFAHVGAALDLPNVSDVVIIGQGNVAIDCARVLAKTRDALAGTDLADKALETLAQTRVRRVSIVGRRSHVQAACTIKELRELSRLPQCTLMTDAEEMALGDSTANAEEATARPRKRISELIEGFPRVEEGNERYACGGDETDTQIRMRFLAQPLGMEGCADDQAADGAGRGRVARVRFGRSQLTGPAGAQKVSLVQEQAFTLPAQLVITSVGYKCEPLPGVPFDLKQSVVPSVGGRVVEEEMEEKDDKVARVVPGLYVAGWLKRGPTGIIGTNIPDAKETAAAVLTDIAALAACGAGELPGIELGMDVNTGAGADAGVWGAAVAAGGEVVDWTRYLRIQDEEVRAGLASNPSRPRRKFTTIDTMLDVK